MALIKLADFVSAISGKVGGTVYSKNKGGAYRKQFTKPTNPQTSFQQAVRAAFGGFAQAWRSLTDLQRTAWNAAVANFQKANRLGDLKTLSGKALYQALNQNLHTIGVVALSEPPMPQGVASSLALSVTADVSDNEINVEAEHGVPAGSSLVIEATPALSAGVNNANNKFNVVKIVNGGGSSVQDIATEYTARYGSFPAAGSKIFARLKYVNATTGEASPYSSVSCIVTA